jgi:ureidoglycolate hydrolase
MVKLSEKLLEVRQHTGVGYLPLVDFAAWRVAILNFADELRLEKITRLQRHNETDEVFVLLQGRCLLFVGSGADQVTRIHGVNLEPRKLYNVRKGVWHHHALSVDAMVLVVENRDTTYDNSPFCELSAAQLQELRKLGRELPGNDQAP